MKLSYLTIVVPCYNEEDVFPDTVQKLSTIMNNLVLENLIHPQSKILFVDDGSSDSTWHLIETESKTNNYVTGVKLSHNSGHQNALIAGLETAKEYSDCVISIDADLQDDIHVIKQFVEKFHDGYDIVYGVRQKRDTDTFFKRTTAHMFYQIMRKMGIDLIPDHADFRLMSQRALYALSRYKEDNLFLRGIVPMIGFKSTCVLYDRKERLAGKSKYPLKKMLSFAFDGITSFSITPIRLVTFIGFLSVLISIAAGSYALYQELFGHTESGWTSLMISIWFIGGVQLMSIGLIGEYIGKIFKEVKRRPRYTIESDLFSTEKAKQIFIDSRKVIK
ncbi:glycosyltransferase family 2 protein [Terrilactibacillus laevilacticus]|uniref:Glycosyltransferase family 2 protein n=1 Tax=Terrilactibacillus laevilacticus TaxID=1380157 RepID=A0ABW5PQR1_9BACI|nr:glycosyltransferase family 2 protein [Terrilactibacillus laevilacticus]